MLKLIDSSDDLTRESASGLVFLDFFGTWCGPCRALVPFLEAESKRTGVVGLKIDVDKVPSAAEFYGVRSVPTVVVLRDGKPIEGVPTLVGSSLREKLPGILDAALAAAP